MRITIEPQIILGISNTEVNVKIQIYVALSLALLYINFILSHYLEKMPGLFRSSSVSQMEASKSWSGK